MAGEELERLRARKESTDPGGLLDWIPSVTKRFERPAHLAPLVERLECVGKERLRLVVSVPPRHAKTETVLHFLPWFMLQHPGLTSAYVSYAAEFARSKSRRARQLARDVGVRLADDAQRLEEWRTEEGGGLLATGIGGPLTGHGVDGVLFVDDPTKNREEAESRVYRERNWEWLRDVAFTRLEPEASAVVLAARWHVDDLPGRLIAQGWEHLRIPAINDAGEPLWPERWSLERLQEIRETLLEYSWASLYQGLPRPRGGTVFSDPTFYRDLPEEVYRTVIGLDFAYTAKTRADCSVAVVVHGAEEPGEDPKRPELTAYIANVVRKQVRATEFVPVLKHLQSRYPDATFHACIGGTEKGVIDFMREHGVRVHYTIARGDKLTRNEKAAAAWNRGRVRVPSAAPWLDALVGELGDFTGVNDAHDDQADALAAAVAALTVGAARGRGIGIRVIG